MKTVPSDKEITYAYSDSENERDVVEEKKIRVKQSKISLKMKIWK